MEKTVQFPNNHLIFFSLIKMNCLKKEITLNVIQKKKKNKRTRGGRGKGHLFLQDHDQSSSFFAQKENVFSIPI